MNATHWPQNLLRVLLMGTILSLALPGWAENAPSLEGLWKAHKRVDADLRGPVVIDINKGWAEFAGERVSLGCHVNGDGNDDDDAEDICNGGRWTADFSTGLGRFEGRVFNDRLIARWEQPSILQIGARASSPVRVRRGPGDRWIGTVTPMPSQFTFYLPVSKASDGSYRTFLRNPERNLGIFVQVERLELDGEQVRLVGRFRGDDQERTLVSGRYFADSDHFRLDLPAGRGGAYDFYRQPDPRRSDFRAQTTDEWTYRAPPQLEDGWRVGTLEDANIDKAPIKDMIERFILPADDSVHSLNVHGMLVARGGVLVLEEYFHGFHRDLVHDTRSAGKSLGSVLVGAARHKGVEIGPETLVYEALGEAVDDLEPRKGAMRLEDLLTMASGFYCDDGDAEAPGNENTLQSQDGEPDWYRYTLDLPMAHAPGEQPTYCSATSNLIGAVVSARAGRSLAALVQEWIAEPLQIPFYHLNLQPTGELYLGGGSHWRMRDYIKLPQMMLDGGTWNGTRIVPEAWARQSTSEAVRLGERAYGWQWWIEEYEWQGRTVQAFFAAGNGGQIFMGIPEADLVIAFWGGNYSDRAGRRAQSELIPDYILPATRP